MKAIKFLVIFCFALLCNSQGFGQVTETTTETPKQIGKGITDPSNDTQNKSVYNQIRAKDESEENYRIGFQDAVEVRVARHSELTEKARVSSDGTIQLPRIDEPIVAVCKTELELKEEIEKRYQSFLKRPYVSVSVVEYRSQSAGVLGAVQKPGAFTLNRKIRLLELLSFAGGPNVEFAGAKIQVARVGNVTACQDKEDLQRIEEDKIPFFTYKLKDVQDGNVNPWIKPGDIVTVMTAEEAYVVGDVGEPTKISLREPVTLTQAIAAAKGIGSEAKTSKVSIQRQEPNSPVRTRLVYDLKDIYSKKIPDPVLQANDIVDVPKNGIKSVRNGLIKAITGGIPGLFYGL